MNLELFALRWLRWERRCPIVLCERSPRYATGQPDCLGVTMSRYLTEIEVKRSVSDFKADFKKTSRVYRDMYVHLWARQFYYLVPDELVDRVTPLVPEWSGLMRGPTRENYAVTIVKQAPVNKASKRLSIRECCKLVLGVSNHALSEMERFQSAIDRFKEGHCPWPHPDYEI